MLELTQGDVGLTLAIVTFHVLWVELDRLARIEQSKLVLL